MFDKIKIDHQNIFFISDFHVGHQNVIRFDNRPFKNLDEMHMTLINNWNNVVGDDDIVFYLGDLFYRCHSKYPMWFVHQLKGKIHFILGNHDRYRDISKLNRFETISTEAKLDVKDDSVKGRYQHFHLHHHPIISWNKASHGAIHLHGHCHQKMAMSPDYAWLYKRKIMDVGCNGINYTPISYTQVQQIMNSKLIGSDEEI
jgi:calcineurin-like phosphoesterase family protein